MIPPRRCPAAVHVPALDLAFDPDRAGEAPTRVWELVAAELDEAEVTGIEERNEGDWRVYFRTAPARAAAARVLRARYGTRGVRVTPRDVAVDDWAARSQQSLTAVRVGRLLVAPPWEPLPRPTEALVIVIQPSMGFGTGHHASTRLCLRLLQALPLAGRTVLDVGTGSGILAIAAARLGARRVVGVDVDPDAIAAARENVALNGVADRVALVVGDIRDGPAWAADVVCANLTAAFFLRYADALITRVAPGGVLLAGGFECADAPAVTTALASVGVLEVWEVEGAWVGQRWRIASAVSARLSRADHSSPHRNSKMLSATSGTASARSVRGPRRIAR